MTEYLNNNGYKTKVFMSRRGKSQGGKDFIDTYIVRILKNPIYIGKTHYKGKIYQGKHTPIIDEEIFTFVQDMINIEGLVKRGVCGSCMTPVWAVSKGKRYFYYDCTSVQHRGRGVCSVRSINAEVLEGLVLKRIEEISQNEIHILRLVSRASGKTSFKVKDLEEKRILLKLRIKELEKKGSLLDEKKNLIRLLVKEVIFSN